MQRAGIILILMLYLLEIFVFKMWALNVIDAVIIFALVLLYLGTFYRYQLGEKQAEVDEHRNNEHTGE